VKRGVFHAFSLALGVVLTLSGCAPREVPPPPGGRPAVLRIGFTPSEEAVSDRAAANLALARHLERTLPGLKVTLVRTPSYGPAVEAMSRGEIDLMGLPPFAYVLASKSNPVEAIAVTGTAQSGPRTYQSALITHRRTGVTRLEDLPAAAKQLRFNFTDPASNSGHLVPQARLAELGLVAERDFAATEFTLSHIVSVFNVAFGRADVAGVSDSVLHRLIAKGRVRREDIVTLWTSDPLPNGPIAVRRNLPPDFKRELQQALVSLATADPVAALAVMEQYPERNLIYLPCDDSLYDGVRALAARVTSAATR
jgi:phosphonate transport system substrate-binding protein